MRKVPSCSLFDLEQFPRHLAFKTQNKQHPNRGVSRGALSLGMCPGTQEVKFLFTLGQILPSEHSVGLKGQQNHGTEQCPCTVPFLFYILVHLYPAVVKPSQYLPCEPLSSSLKNTTHLRASAAQIPHQLRSKGLRSFRQPLFL